MTTLELTREQISQKRYATYQKYAQTVNDFQAYRHNNPKNLEHMTKIYVSEIDSLQAHLASLQAQLENYK